MAHRMVSVGTSVTLFSVDDDDDDDDGGDDDTMEKVWSVKSGIWTSTCMLVNQHIETHTNTVCRKFST